MKELRFRWKQIVILIMLLMIATVSCFVLTGCDKTDGSMDNSNEVVQFEEEEMLEDEILEEEPDDVAAP